MNKKLLYFNLAIDEKDTSLGFNIDWLKTIGANYESVDVVSLRVESIPNFDSKINIYGPNNINNKFIKYYYFLKYVRKLTKENNYDRCFSHMSPISVFLAWFYLYKYNIKTTLWFTHPGPKFGIKKLILYLAFCMSEYVVTASDNSFPFKGKKVNVIGHAVNLDKFKLNIKSYKFNNFLILSRISKSKNLDTSIEGFLNSNFKDSTLEIIGGPLNKEDEEYFKFLKKKYESKKIKFLGKIPHKDLPDKLKKYDVNINSAGKGFFDKSVLETLSTGMINFYRNPDFDLLFNSKNDFYFENAYQLSNAINSLNSIEVHTINNFLTEININLELNSLNSLNKRLGPYL